MSAALLVAATVALQPATARSQTTDILATTRDATPDGNGVFSTFFAPVLNDAGQVAFSARLANTANGSRDDEGLFLTSVADANIVRIAREGLNATSFDGTFSYLNGSGVLLNNAGHIVFGGTSRSSGRGIFRSAGTRGTLTQLIGVGESAPDGNGTFFDFGIVALNDAGQIAFAGLLTDTVNSSDDSLGIFTVDDTASRVTQVARQGQTAPDANGVFSSINAPSLNATGQTAFRATLVGTTGGTTDDRGVFRGDDSLAQIVREPRPTPDPNIVPDDLIDIEYFDKIVAINDSGQVAFNGVFPGSSDPATESILLDDGTPGGLVEIARQGQVRSGSSIRFTRLFKRVLLNNSGQVAFGAALTDTSVGVESGSGYFRSDGTSTGLIQIVKSGDAAPNSDGILDGFNGFELNDAGQAAFSASLFGTASGLNNISGLFFYDDGLGIVEIAREGDSLLGSTITSLGFKDSETQQSQGSGFNNLGQVAYRFTLADGRSGIALWSMPIPEPASIILLGLALIGCASQNRVRSK